MPKIWIAHDIGRAINPVLARGQVEGSVYMGLGEALMEEQIFRRLPPKLSNALVHKIPSMLEYKSPTSLDMPEVITELDRGPGPERPVRREGSRPGAAAADDAGASRTRSTTRSACASTRCRSRPRRSCGRSRRSARGRRRASARTRFPAVPYPEPMLVPPPWEGRRRQRGRTSAQTRNREGRARVMMRLPWFSYHAPRTVAEAARILAGEGPNAMADRGRHRPPAEHEAPPPDAEDARVAAARRRAQGDQRTAAASRSAPG